ncbi:hypothetical protein [Demequina sp. NBRC 110054]|uniref:hypothetical protein n=1 Tax=Demequina sp. NBRC 110054 TaxID=1570343 RepID=UPI001F1F0790|nr:hypothetical protein [Demequina sp. NBRC 110054]
MRMIPTIASLSLLPLLAACATSEADGASSSTSASSEASASAEAVVADGSTEYEEAQPRLVVTYAEGAEVLSLDGSEIEPLAEVDMTAGAFAALGADGRFVYFVDYTNGVVSILDAGTWAEAHGDHYHYFTGDVELLEDQILGAAPTHVIGHDGIVAVFQDGDGQVTLVDEVSLAEGTLSTSVVETNEPHHGVAVPVEGGLLYTETPDGGLPDTVVQIDSDGNEVARYDGECAGLHGEAVDGDLALFGCYTEILVIDMHDNTSSTIAYPELIEDVRVGTFYEGDPLVGNWTGEEILLVDAEGGTSETLNVGGTVGKIARMGDDIIVLTTDGLIRVFSPEGELETEVQAIEAYELPEGHSTAGPAIAVTGDTVVVTDYAGEQIVLVDATDGEVVGTYELDGQPTGVVIAGTAADDAEAHDHDHDED